MVLQFVGEYVIAFLLKPPSSTMKGVFVLRKSDGLMMIMGQSEIELLKSCETKVYIIFNNEHRPYNQTYAYHTCQYYNGM